MGTEKRLSDNSVNQQIFEKAIPIHQADSDRYGYKYKLEYKPKITPQKAKKKRNFVTNEAQISENIDTQFKTEHPLSSVVNRTTVKVSYRAILIWGRDFLIIMLNF